MQLNDDDRRFLDLAIEQARIGWDEGGVPIGAALVHFGANGPEVLAVGRNRRVQMGSAIRHGETDCLENAGRLPASVYRNSVLYTTLSPCTMCAGTAILYDIPRVVIGENRSFEASEEWLRSKGTELVVVDDAECIGLMNRMMSERPEIWAEDIGVETSDLEGAAGEARAVSAGSTGTQQTTDAQAGSAPIDPDYPVTPVPQHARKGFFSLMVVLLGFTIFTPTMLAGASLGKAFGLSELLVVIALGSAVLGTYVAVLGWIGARTGLTTVVMARYTLGTRGSKLASVLLGGTQIGWYGVVVGTIGELTAQAFGWESYAAKAAVMIVVSALMCATAVYGYRGMYWVSLISTPLILILAFWVMFRSLDEVGGWAGLAAIHPSGSMPIAVAVTAVVGTFVSAGTQAPNWTRFGRSGGQAVLACVVGFLVGNGLMIFFGAIGAITFGEGDFVLVLFNLGMIGWGLFLLFGNLWKSNADAAYSFGVAGAELFNRPSKTRFVIFGSVIGTVLALVGVHQHLPQYLGLLGTFIPPLGGVIIGDYLARWRRTQMPEGEALPRFNWVNLGVYVVACAAAWVSGQFSFGIPPVIGIAVALLLSVALTRFGPQRPLQGLTEAIDLD